MKICHWTQFNGSGMNSVAEEMVRAERALGIDAIKCNSFVDKDWTNTFDADVHVSHTWFPETYNGKSLRRQFTKPFKIVNVGHGTPEHVFYSTIEQAEHGGYGHGDAMMLYQYWMQHADALVTFWPRHQAIWQTMVDKHTKVDLVPMGIDTKFWAAGAALGKEVGSPSVWSSENAHQIKWPLDLILMWPMVYPHIDGANLHLNYVPTSQHRAWAPLINRNGAGYGMHWSDKTWPPENLRNIFKGIDFFIGLVRYGDHNRLCLEANAANPHLYSISYGQNPYSDYWLTEGDQRVCAKELIGILSGDVSPRKKDPVPDCADTAREMIKIYERIVDEPSQTSVSANIPLAFVTDEHQEVA